MYKRQVPFSGVTNATPVACYKCQARPPSPQYVREEGRTGMMIDSFSFSDLFQTSCGEGWEEGGDDAKSAWPSDTLGYTRVTIASTTGRNVVRRSKPL